MVKVTSLQSQQCHTFQIFNCCFLVFSVFSFFSVFSVFFVFSIFGTPLDLSESYCFFSFFSVSSFFQFFSVFGTPLDLSDFFYVCSFFSENVGTCTGSMPATIRTSSKYISTLGLKNTVKNDARNRPQTIYIYKYIYIH